MTEEAFKKELKKNLRFLTKKNRDLELNKFNYLEKQNLTPREIANSIYESYNLPYRIKENITLKDAILILISGIKNKNMMSKMVSFLLYILVMIIVIKIPFIYVRDTMGSIFSGLTTNKNGEVIWSLLIEVFYAIATILIIIRLIKNKALEIEKDVNSN